MFEQQQVAIELAISAPDDDGQTTLDLTVGREDVMLQTTAQPCVLAEHTECAAQFAAMFAVDRPGYGTQTLDLQPLGPAPGGGADGRRVNVQVSLAIAATSDEHADRILQTFL